MGANSKKGRYLVKHNPFFYKEKINRLGKQHHPIILQKNQQESISEI